VKIHLHMAYQKLGTANRAGLAVFMFSSDAALINDGDEASCFGEGLRARLTRKQKRNLALRGARFRGRGRLHRRGKSTGTL
jgi:hypothetical protein